MRAVVVCCNFGWAPEALLRRRPFCLMPVGRTPMAQIVLEQIISKGLRRVTLVVSDEADYVQGHFGAGQRWGATVDYVLLKRFEGIGETLRRLPGQRGEDILVVPGMLFTEAGLGRLVAARERGALAAVSVFEPGQGGSAGEMALLAPEAAGMLPAGLTRLTPRIAAWAYEGKAEVVRETAPAYWVEDFAGFWRAHQAALSGAPGLGGGVDTKPRVGLRGSIGRGAAFSPPVIIGDDVEIGRGCRIGPNVVIGDGCILDEGVEASDCLLMAGTYFGPETSIVSAVADQGLLVRYPDGAATHVPDFFIMGPVNALTSGRGLSEALQRLIAVALICLASPLLLALRLAGLVLPGTWRRHGFAGHAALDDLSGKIGLPEVEVTLFESVNPLLKYLPALLDVARGRIDLVGVELIDVEHARALIGTFAESRLFCRPGLIPPWAGMTAMTPDDMEKRVMEVYFANTRSLAADMKLLWSSPRGFLRLIRRP